MICPLPLSPPSPVIPQRHRHTSYAHRNNKSSWLPFRLPPPSPPPSPLSQVKLAYEAILEREAGYRPPPPGSAPNMKYAETYWHTHSTDGRVPWGKYAGG